MDDNADAKRILLASPPADWRRQLGRPRITWLCTNQQDLKQNHLTLPEAADLAQNRPLWRMMSTYGATQSWVACQKWRQKVFLDKFSAVLTVMRWCVDSASSSSICSSSSIVTPGHAIGTVPFGRAQGVFGLVRNPSRYCEWCWISSTGPGNFLPSGIITVPSGCRSIQ